MVNTIAVVKWKAPTDHGPSAKIVGTNSTAILMFQGALLTGPIEVENVLEPMAFERLYFSPFLLREAKAQAAPLFSFSSR